MALRQLREKLFAKGYFDPRRKKPLPRVPRRLALVTSPTGAAVRDMLEILARRWPAVEIWVCPVRVQGDGAAAEIAAGIHLINSIAGIDVMIVGRGGGSLEDLWAFNEEAVARAVFESAVPVVSAIGHEIDFTICDFVADVRAATPSAAAEIITEGVFASRQFVAETPGWMGQRIHQRLGRERENLEQLTERIARSHPSRRLNEKLQLLDDLQSSLLRGVKYRWREYRTVWHDVGQRMLRVRPAQLLERRLESWRELDRRLCERTHQGVKDSQNRFVTLEARLRLLSPTNVLERGYSVTFDAETGQVIRDATEVKPGQRLKTRLKKGEIRSVAEG